MTLSGLLTVEWKRHDVLINVIYYPTVYGSTTTLLLKVITLALRWIFGKWEGVETGWSWLRIGIDGGHL